MVFCDSRLCVLTYLFAIFPHLQTFLHFLPLSTVISSKFQMSTEFSEMFLTKEIKFGIVW